jgi:hypothetical protein
LISTPTPLGARGLSSSALPVEPELTAASRLPRSASISPSVLVSTMPPPVTSSSRMRLR